MCGIFAYYSYHKPVTIGRTVQLLLDSLRRLEYRGYDSAGVCFDVSPEEVAVIKAVGNVSELQKKLDHDTSIDFDRVITKSSCIAHTRWATHGMPSIANCHPHTSDDTHAFVVVHNGVITNFQAIKDELIRTTNFTSETDTEVIPKLCKYIYEQLGSSAPVDFPTLVHHVLRELEGTYALVIKSKHYPNELIACKRGSSLVIGLAPQSSDGSFECWMSSDSSALVQHTHRALFLDDNDILHIKEDSYTICSSDQLPVTRALETLHQQVHDMSKGQYAHYMLKEIHEQPSSVRACLQGRVAQLSGVKLGGIEPYVESIRRCKRILLIGCGTSYHACLATRYAMEELCDTPVAVELASDFLDRKCPLFRDDTCVFVSQSGETADTLAALEYAKQCGTLCVGITNGIGSAIARQTHCGIYQKAGYEVGVASTKAYTTSVVCLVLMCLLLGSDSVRKASLIDSVISELHELPTKIDQVLQRKSVIERLAEDLKTQRNLLFIARGNNIATALEASLKIKEVAQIHSEGLFAGELKHGPLALVDDDHPVIAIATHGNPHVYEKMKTVVHQITARKSRCMVLCNDGDDSFAATCLYVPSTVDILQPILNIIPFQLLAYYLALKKGLNVDQPRNLAKSVTVA